MDKQQLSPTEPQQQLSPEQKQALNEQLLISVRCNDESEVEKLLKNGADVNAVYENGMTALMWACYNGNLDIAKFLIAKGAEVNSQKQDGETALMLACMNGHWDIVKTDIVKMDIVKLLIANKADVNAKDKKGNTALMVACSNDNLQIAELLLEKGANVNAVYENGMTSLMLACYNGNLDIAKILIENGADVNGQELNALRYFDIQELKELAKSLLESEYLNNKTDKTNNLSEERKKKLLLEQKCQTTEDSIKFITELCKRIKASRLLIKKINIQKSIQNVVSNGLYIRKEKLDLWSKLI